MECGSNLTPHSEFEPEKKIETINVICVCLCVCVCVHTNVFRMHFVSAFAGGQLMADPRLKSPDRWVGGVCRGMRLSLSFFFFTTKQKLTKSMNQ